MNLNCSVCGDWMVLQVATKDGGPAGVRQGYILPPKGCWGVCPYCGFVQMWGGAQWHPHRPSVDGPVPKDVMQGAVAACRKWAIMCRQRPYLRLPRAIVRMWQTPWWNRSVTLATRRRR